MANKELDLFKELIPSIDMGFKELYDAAGEDGKKDIKLDLWNLNRYISSVKGNFEKTALAVFKVNEYYNKNFFTLLLSYCPGGIYEVAVIAIFFDLDPEFVSFHHIIRLLMILFTVPAILKLISKKA